MDTKGRISISSGRLMVSGGSLEETPIGLSIGSALALLELSEKLRDREEEAMIVGGDTDWTIKDGQLQANMEGVSASADRSHLEDLWNSRTADSTGDDGPPTMQMADRQGTIRYEDGQLVFLFVKEDGSTEERRFEFDNENFVESLGLSLARIRYHYDRPSNITIRMATGEHSQSYVVFSLGNDILARAKWSEFGKYRVYYLAQYARNARA